MRPIWKKILVASIVLNVVFASVAAYGYFVELNKYDVTFNPRQELSGPPTEGYVWQPSGWYTERCSLFKQVPLDADDVVFLGDSITEGGDWRELFPDADCRNRGIAGDTTQGILHRLDMITQAKPRKLFLMIGINDLGARGKLEIPAILDDYRQILERLVEESPETQVYVQSVLPINTRMFKPYFTNNDVEALNVGLLEMSSEMGVGYIDLYSRFIKDSQLDETYTSDGLHLNPQGYYLWRDDIRDLVS